MTAPRFTDARTAIRAIPDGSTVILPQGCAEPSTLYAAFTEEVDRFHDLRLCSGLQFGGYSFLSKGLGKHFSYRTWQVGRPVRDLISSGRAEYLPLRYSDILRSFSNPDVVLLQTSLPDRSGRVSLGVSVGLARDLALSARLVIAEAGAAMPFTCGESTIPLDRIDLLVEGGSGLNTYRAQETGPVEQKIATHLADLIPEDAVVEVGIGAVPQALVELLADRRDVRIHTGMVTDGIVRFAPRSKQPVITGEVAGSPELYRFVDRNPRIELRPASRTHDVATLARMARFIAVNSAFEVDLSGQVNAETLDGAVVGGVGGSLDFMEGAALSPGGMAVIALPATARGGKRSRIVPCLSRGAPVTVPRHCVHYVVTEHGVAELRGKSLRERAQALIGIADPGFRNCLDRAHASHGGN